MFEIMKALYETGFDGPIRPDHGRMIWGEKAMPGYGLYDRALGASIFKWSLGGNYKGGKKSMKLNEEGLKNRNVWENAGYRLPAFDREKVRLETKKHPFGFISEQAIFSGHFRQTLCSIY